MAAWRDPLADEDEDEGPVLAHPPVKDDSELDITPMIDITFLLLIFFIVATEMANPGMKEMAKAKHGDAVAGNSASVITIKAVNVYGAAIFLADGATGTPLAGNLDQQTEAIRQFVEAGTEQAQPKRDVLIKAEKGVLRRHVNLVEQAAMKVKDVQIYLAVLEAR